VSDEPPRRLRVNPVLCRGFGYCAEIVPELISRDDWGYPILNPDAIDADGLLHLARKAVAVCPQVALLLEELAPISIDWAPGYSRERPRSAISGVGRFTRECPDLAGLNALCRSLSNVRRMTYPVVPRPLLCWLK
jgi:ferredoxin